MIILRQEGVGEKKDYEVCQSWIVATSRPCDSSSREYALIVDVVFL